MVRLLLKTLISTRDLHQQQQPTSSLRSPCGPPDPEDQPQSAEEEAAKRAAELKKRVEEWRKGARKATGTQTPRASRFYFLIKW